MSKKTPSLLPVATLVAALPFLGGCRPDEIQVYQVPKENPPALASAASSTAAPAATPSAAAGQSMPHLHWEALPAGWTDGQPAQMRVASFAIPNPDGPAGDVGVIPLPLMTGREADVVNIWREQLGLPELEQAEAESAFETVTIAGMSGKLLDLTSEENMLEGEFRQRIVSGILHHGGLSWFFKLTGPDDLVAVHKPRLVDFMTTVEFHSGSHDSPEPAPSVAATAPAAPGSGLPQWTVPEGWRAEAPGNMLLASYDLGDNTKVTVSSFPGDVGGLLANVNRWRGQIGLPPIGPAELADNTTDFEAAAGSGTLADMENNGRRILVVVLSIDGNSWFYKIDGDAAVVEREKEAMLEFVRTAQH